MLSKKKTMIALCSAIVLAATTVGHSYAYSTESYKKTSHKIVQNMNLSENYADDLFTSSRMWGTDHDTSLIRKDNDKVTYEIYKGPHDNNVFNGWKFCKEQNYKDGKYYFEVELMSSRDTDIFVVVGASHTLGQVLYFNVAKDKWTKCKGYVNTNVMANGGGMVFSFGQELGHTNSPLQIGDTVSVKNVVIKKIN